MARILSHIDAIRRGSVAGTTYFANQYHQILARARTAPVQPNTVFQQGIRDAMVWASVQWRFLTPEHRQDWDDYAQTLTYDGPLGPYQVPGRLVFISNLSLAVYGLGREALPPPTVGQAPTIAGFLNSGPYSTGPLLSPGIGFTVNITGAPDQDIFAYVQHSIGFNQTRNRFKGPWLSGSWTQLEVLAGTTTSDPFINLTDEAAYFVRIRCVSQEAPFKVSTPAILRVVAQEFVV